MGTMDNIFDGSNAHLLTEEEIDAAELRDIAKWFDSQGKSQNGEFLRRIAIRIERTTATSLAKPHNARSETTEPLAAKVGSTDGLCGIGDAEK